MDTKESLILKRTQQENTELTDALGEAIFLLRLCAPFLPKPKVSTFSKHVQEFIDKTTDSFGEDIENFM